MVGPVIAGPFMSPVVAFSFRLLSHRKQARCLDMSLAKSFLLLSLPLYANLFGTVQTIAMHLARRHHIVVNTVSEVRRVRCWHLQPGKCIAGDWRRLPRCSQRTEHPRVVGDSR